MSQPIVQKIFAYNTGAPIFGTTQVGDIAVSDIDVEYSDNYGGVQWWGGPNEANGYVIAHTDPTGGHNGEPSTPAYLGFWRSSALTDQSFLDLCNSIPPRIGFPPFTNTSDASAWLAANGYWTSFTSITPTPTATQAAVTPTPTTSPVVPTPTPTGTPASTPTPTGTPASTPTPTPTHSAPSGFSVTLVESGGNVVMSASGSLNINGLTLVNPSAGPFGGGGIGIGSAEFLMVRTSGLNGAQYSGFTTTPSNFGTGGGSASTSASGDTFGVLETVPGTKSLIVPTGYTTGNAISSIQTFSGATFSSLGLTPGTYTYTWGSGANADSINVVIGGAGVTPTPTTTSTPTPSVTNTQTPSTTPTNTSTPTVTPTLTPTPSTTPSPVTGYSFNLVVLPYNYPTSGNTIMVDQAISGTGTTNPNVFATTNNAIYFNAIDTNGIDRTSYFASFTGQSITLTISQTGSTAIYSGDTNAFQSWSGLTGGPPGTPGKGFSFGYGIAQPGYSAGTTVLIQSATTNWVTGQTVYISASVNGPGVTPTPTSTSVTPTPTPTSGYTSDGWLFYSPDNQPVLTAPSNNGNTTFINTGGGNGTYSPNYTGGTLNIYFNNNTANGTSYLTQFQGLDTTGGTMTISQGSSVAIYSGISTNYQVLGSFFLLTVNNSAQMIQSASTRFVSGTTINVVVN